MNRLELKEIITSGKATVTLAVNIVQIYYGIILLTHSVHNGATFFLLSSNNRQSTYINRQEFTQNKVILHNIYRNTIVEKCFRDSV